MPNTVLTPSTIVPAPKGPNKKKKQPFVTATAEKKPAKK